MYPAVNDSGVALYKELRPLGIIVYEQNRE